MSRYPICLRSLLTLLILMTGVSASEAGLFGRWRARNDYTYYVYTPCQPTAVSMSAAAGQPVTSTAGPIVYTAAKPVISDNGGSQTIPVVPAPQYNNYVPAAPSGSGWSTLPRGTQDFGKYPPYSY